MKKKLSVICVLILTIISAGMLSGCSQSYSFDQFVGFKVEDVERVAIISEHNVIKETTAVDKVFEAFAKTKFNKSKVEKYESEWNINRKMTVNFYLKGEKGYYSIILNNGARAMEEFAYKKATTGFYEIDNLNVVVDRLNVLFYN